MAHCRTIVATALLTLTASALMAGCSDNFGERCALPRIVEQNCRSENPASATNCVMTDNLSCDSRICAVWQDSTSFCTVDCADDADCPGGSSCVPFFLDSDADKFCVLDKELKKNPPPQVGGGGGSPPAGGGDAGAGDAGAAEGGAEDGDPPAGAEGEGEGES